MKLNWFERLVVNNPVRVGVQRLEMAWLRSRVRLGPAPAILEIGCGRGAGAGLILKNFAPARLHAFDLDRRMVRRAPAYLAERVRSQVHFYVGDALHLPYRDGVWDVVCGFGVLHHIQDWPEALAEIARVLKPGGVYVLEEFYPPVYQNLPARYLFAHPQGKMFGSRDLKATLQQLKLPVQHALEVKWAGILAVAVKEG
jgi:ubiquinone/menaquinone biosynthesis C-methylase UbiE